MAHYVEWQNSSSMILKLEDWDELVRSHNNNGIRRDPKKDS
jgi:hypothetical protein